jgi:hypothetical protein
MLLHGIGWTPDQKEAELAVGVGLYRKGPGRRVP